MAPPFWDELTTSAPSSKATRVSPPGSTLGLAAGAQEHERAQVDVARLEPAVDHRRVSDSGISSWAMKSSGAASHVASRLLDVVALGVRADDHALAAVGGARLDDQLVEAVERLLEHLGAAEVVGAHGRQQRLLAEVVAHHVLDVGVHELVVADADAERVDQPEPAARATACPSIWPIA